MPRNCEHDPEEPCCVANHPYRNVGDLFLENSTCWKQGTVVRITSYGKGFIVRVLYKQQLRETAVFDYFDELIDWMNPRDMSKTETAKKDNVLPVLTA